jgi:hypothetical protein
MVRRRPLVNVSGTTRELPTGDTLSTLGGYVDCSELTTASAINAAANPSACGTNATIWLGPRASGSPLVVDEPILVWEGQTWLGAGGREVHTVLQAGSGLGAGLPMMCAEGWYNSAGDADNGVIIRGIHFDLNSKSGRSGLIVYNYWSLFEDLQFVNGAGATAQLLVTDVNRSAVNSSNSHSENRFVGLRFDTTTTGCNHFQTVTANGISNQDGHIMDSFFAGSSGAAITIARAAGWTIENNHIYACGENAIDLNNCYATKCIGNYVEDFGKNNVTTGPTSGYYAGITMSVLDGKPSICALNTVEQKSPTTPAYNSSRGIAARAGSGQNDARLVIIGNTISLSGSATNTEGFHLGEGGDSSRTLNLMMSGNQLDPRGSFATPIAKANSTVRMMKDLAPVRSFTGVTGTVTLDNEFEMVQNFTCTGDTTVNLPGSNVNARDGDPFQLRFLASGAQRTITLNASVVLSTGISSRVFVVPSGKMLAVALEWSSLLTAYVLTAATTTA